jgi:parallel beta-helix repeat protein
MLRRLTLLTALALTAMAFGASPALAADRTVAKPTDLACGKNTPYNTIQAAVNASSAGDSIHVCPGLYREQVVIGPGKDKLKLESVRDRQAAIKFPAGVLTDPKAVVLVRQAKGVEIKKFTIEGPWEDTSDCTSTRHYGIKVDTGGSAKIDSNHITLIWDNIPALRGCQDGVAVQVGRSGESTTGSAEIVHNVIDKYQKNGPTIDGTGSSGFVHENTIDGGGENQIIAKNGIQVGRGASAKVEKNEVFNNYYSGVGPPPAGDVIDDNDGTGILVFEVAGGVTVHENTLYLNDLGFALGTASGVLVDNNTTTSNTFDGLRAESDTSGNTFQGNKSSSNGMHDCHDASTGGGTAGTANTWKDNQGNTQTPAGICKPN